jgi:DNA gyrase/topoisomerase IV subunit A
MAHVEQSLASYVEGALTAYSNEVLQQRAVPDFRDGLKPVHRAIIWAMAQEGMYPSHLKKCARAVGSAMGKFHPHGDGAIYQALIGISGVKSQDKQRWVVTHVPEPLILGQGNFGSSFDSPAAMRYTECSISEVCSEYLLDKDYLAVSDFTPNYMQDDTLPLVFPAKLPILLLNGSTSIAVGLSASCPSFERKGVLELCKIYLKNKKVSTSDCLKNLVPNFAYGGICVSPQEDRKELYKTGKGALTYQPEVALDEKMRIVHLTSLCRGFTSTETLDKLCARLTNLPTVLKVADVSDSKGFRLRITAQRSVKAGEPFAAFVKAILGEATYRQSFDIGVTERLPDRVLFRRSSVPALIADWCEWRLSMERKVIAYRVKRLDAEKARLELLVFAVSKLDIIFAAVKSKDPVPHLVQKLKIPQETATTIMGLQLRQLARVEQAEVKEQIANTVKKIAETKSLLKVVEQQVIMSLP